MNSKRIKFLLYVCVLCLPLSLSAQHGATSDKSVGIRFMDVSLEKALETASVLNKPVFIDCYTVWCGPCKYLSSDVFPDKRVGDFYNEKFICLQIDMEKGEGLEIAKKYEIKSYPTLLFLDANGEIMHKDVGARDVDGFIKLGETALDPTRNSSTFIKRVKSGEISPEIVEYMLSNSDMNATQTEELLDKLFLNKPETSWSDDPLWSLLSRYAPLKSKYGNYILNNKDLINKLGETQIQTCAESMLVNFYNNEQKQNKDAGKISALIYIESLHSPVLDKAILMMKHTLGFSLAMQDPTDPALWNIWFQRIKTFDLKYGTNKDNQSVNADYFRGLELIANAFKTSEISFIISTIEKTKHEYVPYAINTINFALAQKALNLKGVLPQSACDSINSACEAILKNCTLDPIGANNFAWALVSHPQRDMFLQTAKKLSAYTLTKGDSYFWLDTYATICAQLGQFDEAIKYQAKAIESVKKQDPQKIKFYEDMFDKFKKHETVF